MFEAAVADDVLRLRRPDTRWLSTGIDGGLLAAPACYNVTVPDGWDRTDVRAYAEERRRAAGFAEPGPTLLTGVDLAHVRGARAGPVEVYATVGLSNPAALPIHPDVSAARPDPPGEDRPDAPGTVNLVVGTRRALDDAGLATLLALVAEAKAATLVALTGFPGTTTDAVVVGTDPDGEPAAFAGSATAVGSAARACVREAVAAGLVARYADEPMPDAVESAEHGVRTDRRAEVFELE